MERAMAGHIPAAATARKERIPEFIFLLQPEFPLNALILAGEALRIANQNSGLRRVRWRYGSESGGPVRASNGMWMSVDGRFDARGMKDPASTYYLVLEGNLPTQRNSRALLGSLRALARFGVNLGAVDTGAFALAQ